MPHLVLHAVHVIGCTAHVIGWNYNVNRSILGSDLPGGVPRAAVPWAPHLQGLQAPAAVKVDTGKVRQSGTRPSGYLTLLVLFVQLMGISD